MRRFAWLFLPAVIGMTAAGCSRIEPENPRADGTGEEILVARSFRAGVAETRTSLDGVAVLFAEGESISIWDGSGNREFTADEAGAEVSFSGEVSASATEFHALSPYSVSTVFARSGGKVTATTVLPSEQTAMAGTFAPGLNISAARSDSHDSFSLENVLSLVRFDLSSESLAGREVTSVELKSTYPLAGDVTVTYGETVAAAAGANTVNSVKLVRADGSALGDGSYYFVVLPNAGGTVSLKFTASDGSVATRTATLHSPMEPGVIKNLGTVKNLAWETPKYYFMPVSEVTDGTYLIVADNGGSLLAAKAVVPSSGNTYGYPRTQAVSPDGNGFIVREDLKDAFEFTTTDGGITIRQLLDGKYWYQSGNYTSISIADSVSPDSYYSITRNDDGTFKILNKSLGRYLQYSSSYKTFGSYNTASGIVPTLYRLVDPDTVEAQVVLTTRAATGVDSGSALLNAGYSGLFPVHVVNAGFYYGTTASDLDGTVYVNEPFTSVSGSMSALIESLDENTTYYYRATMQVWDPVSGTYREFLGEVMSFTTTGAAPVTGWKDWLELPANTLTASNYLYDEQRVGTERNYAMSYDKDAYAAMWVAYPLYSATMGDSKRTANWSFNGHFSSDWQVDVTTKSYGVSWTEDYGNELYARGHQIPNADRNVDPSWQNQTFLVTNSTPQIQNRFNASIWGNLESAARTVAQNTDTMYVVTGPVFRKAGGSETVRTIRPQLDPGKEVPVPNYYWKAFLKVKRAGNVVTSALAVGFWYEHRSYVDGEKFDDSQFIVSIGDIQEWTGLDLFTNLPGTNDSGIEKEAEENVSWTAFKSF